MVDVVMRQSTRDWIIAKWLHEGRLECNVSLGNMVARHNRDLARRVHAAAATAATATAPSTPPPPPPPPPPPMESHTPPKMAADVACLLTFCVFVACST